MPFLLDIRIEPDRRLEAKRAVKLTPLNALLEIEENVEVVLQVFELREEGTDYFSWCVELDIL